MSGSIPKPQLPKTSKDQFAMAGSMGLGGLPVTRFVTPNQAIDQMTGDRNTDMRNALGYGPGALGALPAVWHESGLKEDENAQLAQKAAIQNAARQRMVGAVPYQRNVPFYGEGSQFGGPYNNASNLYGGAYNNAANSLTKGAAGGQMLYPQFMPFGGLL
jgi:hypothetical protein